MLHRIPTGAIALHPMGPQKGIQLVMDLQLVVCQVLLRQKLRQLRCSLDG
jgi:hypothetical protein